MSQDNTKPTIEFAPSKKTRFKTIPLEWPLLIDSEELKEITLKRLTGEEVAQMQQALEEHGVGDHELIALFADQPVEVIRALDMDDTYTLKEAAFDFLPRAVRVKIEEAMRAAIEAEEASLIGEPSSQTLPMPSNGEGESS